MPSNSEMAIVEERIQQAPINVAQLIQDLGVDYIEMPMDSGSSGRIDFVSGRYQITVNQNQSRQRKKFTAAHELAHYLLHRDLLHERGHLDRLFDAGGYANPSSPLTPQHEVEANKLAAAILMPREAIREMLVWANFDLHELADRFGVSAASMEIRLRVLGIDLEYEKSQMSRGRDVDIPF